MQNPKMGCTVLNSTINLWQNKYISFFLEKSPS